MSQTVQPSDSFESEIVEFQDRMSVSRIGIAQVNALIQRLETYRNHMQLVLGVLNAVNSAHYAVCKFHILLELKVPIQNMAFARESLFGLIEVLNKDITFYYKQKDELESKYKEKNSGKL